MPTSGAKVAFVITRGDSIGGGQIHVRDLAFALKERGVEVEVYAGTVGALQAELDTRGIAHWRVPGLVRSVNPLDDVRAILALRRLWRRQKPAWVSCHTAKAGLVGRVAAWLCGIPSVFTAHGWQFAEGIAAWQKAAVLSVEMVLARLSRRVITVSDYDRDLALRFRLGSKHKIVRVHNGMPDRPAPERLDRGSSTVRLVMVARFQAQKDHGTLFEALAMLESLPWSLELIGDGPLRAHWESWIGQRGWGERVRFSGQTLDVPQRLETSDIFVLCSLWEGFPRSILEAMRAALPVVASDVGGVSEAVVDNVTGVLVPPQRPQTVANALSRLLADAGLRRQWGAQGRIRFESEFTFDAMLAKTLTVWKSAGWAES